MNGGLKVFFNIEQDDDGYPDVGSESVWALPTADPSVVQLDNIPFFASEATLDDLVIVREENGRLWFDKVFRESSNSLLRIAFFNIEVKDRVNGLLVGLGCRTEYFEQRHLLAVSIPEAASLVAVQGVLIQEAAEGNIDYEEPILRK